MQSVDPEDGPYGAHWWGVEGDTLGTFRASGYEGQSITICPTHDLVVVRLGKTAAAHYPDLTRWRADMVRAVRPRADELDPLVWLQFAIPIATISNFSTHSSHN